MYVIVAQIHIPDTTKIELYSVTRNIRHIFTII